VALAVALVEQVSAPGSGGGSAGDGSDEMVIVFGAVPEEGAEEAPPVSLDQQPVDEHIVQRGDTLSSIALQRLGSASRAAELAKLNGLKDPDHLVPGDRLRLR